MKTRRHTTDSPVILSRYEGLIYFHQQLMNNQLQHNQLKTLFELSQSLMSGTILRGVFLLHL